MDKAKKGDSKHVKQNTMLACDIRILWWCKQGSSVVKFDEER